LEVIEKKTANNIVSEEEIEKEVDKKDPHSNFSSSLWDFDENDNDEGAYVYDSEEQKSENEEDDDEYDEDNPILAQLKALGFNANSINASENDEEITSKILTSVIEQQENIESIDHEIASEYDEEDNELVGSEKWAIEAIKENHKSAEQERDEEEEGEEEEGEEEEGEEEEDEEDAEEEEDEEEGEEEEVEEIVIDGAMYYTTNKKNGIIYEYLSDEEVGDEVGHLEEGILFLS